MGLRVWGLGFRVVYGIGLRVYGLWFTVYGLQCKV
jgi:hypothetical protein